MKIKIKYILFILLIYFQCDKIDNPLEIKSGGFEENVCGETTFADIIDTNRRVLVEDFTGHKCTGCPSMTYQIDLLHQNFENKIVSIAIHEGFFAEPATNNGGKYELDLRAPENSDLSNTFGPIPSYPKAMINRKKNSSNTFLYTTQEVYSKTQNELNKTADIDIKTQSFINDDVNKLCVFTKIYKINNITSKIYAVINIVEDSIIGWQASDGQVIPFGDQANYVHNNVLRKIVNGAIGESINNDSLNNNNFVLLKHTQSISGIWKKSNLKVVTYIYDYNSKEILQVYEEKL